MARVTDWLRRQTAENWLTALLVAGSVLFIFVQLQPSKLLLNTTPNGGDMGAHVLAPAYLRHNLLPHFRLSGWTPDWYAGFPIYVFYMVVPSLLIVLLNVVLFVPYNIAFKLISVSGLLFLPIAAYCLGRLAKLPFPVPAALAAATVPFVFDRSFTIYGGNAASTLAGEFAFTISLVFALLFLGCVLRGLDTGRHRAAAATFLALTVLCHLIPAIFALVAAGVALVLAFEWREIERTMMLLGAAVVGAAVLLGAAKLSLPLAILLMLAVAVAAFASRARVRDAAQWIGPNALRSWWLLSSLLVGALLTGFWTIPFLFNKRYMTDMGWEKLDQYSQILFPGRIGDRLAHIANLIPRLTGGHPHTVASKVTQGDMTYVIALAAIGAVTSVVFRRRFGIWLTATGAALAVLVLFAPQGRLWNARILPFWYLFLYFLAALAVVEIISAIAVLIGGDEDEPNRGIVALGTVVASIVVAAMVAFPLWNLPFGTVHHDAGGNATSYSWLIWKSSDHSFIPAWARWNYSGYEKKPAYPEYRDIVLTMEQVAKDHGCGRAMWELDNRAGVGLDRFGTPMALMLLPYWTDSCVGSMEGLYFEASATTPYHFLNQSELSADPSRAERDLPYESLDVDRGVEHLQLLGVKYYLAFSDQAVTQADKNRDLTLVASIPKCTDPAQPNCVAWKIYEVANSDIVQPLANQPAVVKGMTAGGKTWQHMAVDWYMDPSKWSVPLAASGPSSWQRIREGSTPETRPVDAATVSSVRVGKDTIRFHVDKIGTPVLVKTSYFPNWKVSHAKGPYRVAPNLMVVVPTGHDVSLHYGRTAVDDFGVLVTLLGIGLVVLFMRRGALAIPPPAEVESVLPLDDMGDDLFAPVGASPDPE